MMSTPETPTLLIFVVVTTLVSGLIAMLFGQKLLRYGRGIVRWMVGIALTALLGVVIYGWTEFMENGYQPRIWNKGWILSPGEIGAVSVGVIQDPIGLAMAFLAVIFSCLFLANRKSVVGTQEDESHFVRSDAALAVSSAGVVLSWIALTPWLGLIGMSVTLFGGLIFLGMRWGVNGEAIVAGRFCWEKAWGLVLALVGICVSAVSSSDWVGAGLITAGLFIQFQSFPFLGWIILRSDSPSSVKICLNQLFPAWAAFAMLVRIEPQLRSIGALPIFGWVALGSAVLTMGSAIFQQEWRKGVGTWISASLAIAAGVLAFSGPAAAVAILLGTSIGGLGFSMGASALEQYKSTWSKIACYLSVASGTGVIGFISVFGGVRWIEEAWAHPTTAAVFAFVLFLMMFQGWKLAWMMSRFKSGGNGPWYSLLSPLFLTGFSLGVLWTGTVSGGIISENADQIAGSLFEIFFSQSGRSTIDGSDLMSAFWLCNGLQLIAVLSAYWMSGRQRDLGINLSRAFPRFSEFLSGGYGVDRAGERFLEAIRWTGKTTEWLVDKKIWNQWIPNAIGTGTSRGADAIAKVDALMSSQLNSILRRSIEAPAKVLQFVQNGDVQWYLLFAIGSGFVILIYFLKFIK